MGLVLMIINFKVLISSVKKYLDIETLSSYLYHLCINATPSFNLTDL